MPDQNEQHLTIAAYRTVEGGTQIQIWRLGNDGAGDGYRLAGPKHYNRPTTTLVEHELTERDAVEVRQYLDAVFPPKPVLSEAECTFLSFALDLAFDQMCSRDGFTADDDAALASLRKLAAGGESR